jgi:hypothetical protein
VALLLVLHGEFTFVTAVYEHHSSDHGAVAGKREGALLTRLDALIEFLLALALAIRVLLRRWRWTLGGRRWTLGERVSSPQHPDSQQHRAADMTHTSQAPSLRADLLVHACLVLLLQKAGVRRTIFGPLLKSSGKSFLERVKE